MTRTVYLDCIAGAAGDMLLGALIDAGADLDAVNRGLAQLPVDVSVRLSPARRHSIGATRVEVLAPGEAVHRTWGDVRALIEEAALPRRARERAVGVFRRLAEAEGHVHRIAPDEVHFHEVGAADAIADICGFALALESLAVDELICSPLPLGRGMIDAAHGRLPLPAPATVELLRGIPVEGVDERVELVTPTGAAIVAALVDGFGELPAMRLERAGYGAGERDLASRPNIVRAIVGERRPSPRPTVSIVETNLDDMSPELLPPAVDSCFAAGALDVWLTPVHMKKARPGFVLSALARNDDEAAVCDAVLRNTTSLGVRVTQAERIELERTSETVDVLGQRVRIKIGWRDGATLNVKPEHDDCVAVADRTGASAKDVWVRAVAAATARGET
jgi:pyridinium-3,5-bisthiocarboxylic acid mononucleotide nickel chelatase